MQRPSVVLDCGSGFTKMGFSGNMEPSFVVPTVVALNKEAKLAGAAGSAPANAASDQYRASVAADLDFCIGDEALAAARTGRYSLAHPVERGQIKDWDAMERLWSRCLLDFLRVDPEEHMLLLSESALTTPEQREAVAAIMFETFNVQGLYVAPQPVLSFMAANAAAQTPMTGVVVDAGESSTSVVPVVEGYIIPGCARSIPVGGSHITTLLQHMLQAGGLDVPPEDASSLARAVKESLCYSCSDVVKEWGKHEREPGKYRKLWEGGSRSTKLEVGPERFLAPEALFSADMLELMLSERWAEAAALALESTEGFKARDPKGPSRHIPALPALVDSTIQSAPIDTRRALYKTIVLSGGSTLFKDFGRRLQKDVKKLVDGRQGIAAPAPEGGAQETPSAAQGTSPSPGADKKQSRVFSTSGAVEVSVVSHPVQHIGVWFGGSILASTPAFPQVCHTREMYQEAGPSICRAFQAAVSLS